MRDLAIGEFLDALADRVPAPGGGASAALHAAQAGALLAMVARYSDGPKYAEDAETIQRILSAAEELRVKALRLAEDDATAFGAVAEAYKLPKKSDEEKQARSAAIAAALARAAEPPAEIIAVAEQIVTLAEQLLPVGNRNVVTDIAAATEAARAAATTARINVEINLGGIKVEQTRKTLTERANATDEVARRAELVTARVREEIAK
ncbi:formiminotetrahydrofolate cyclodeaminase [Lentzea atacamensis]|uniref:Formiminotetrahydrofolate cyclodeaminase n=1 Tax=Lentzea atacamensis TaxID=531938 RepID=A0A316HKH0_9PSEU|nr:cyclodeaminase/cyclohydrolase family protein [Lentzea atacamensis]PWK80663.1 formiminotetrahydrofolate cyclodeaminase [Lentzea atacamensis]